MKCDPQASLLACNLANPCLGHKPKAKVATSPNLTNSKCLFGELEKYLFSDYMIASR